MSRPTSAHLYLTTYARTAPPLRTFTHQLSHEPPHICALSPLLLRTFPQTSMGNRPTAANLHPTIHAKAAPRLRTYHITPPYQRVPLSAPSSSDLCTFALFSTEEGICYTMRTERCSHTIESLVPSCTSVCTEVLEKSL